MSLLKRSVASFFILRSRRDSTKPNGPQAGLRPSVQHVIEKGRNSDRFHAVSSKVRTGISRVSLTPFFNGGLYSAEQQALFLVPMEGSDYCFAQSAPVMPHVSSSAPSNMMALRRNEPPPKGEMLPLTCLGRCVGIVLQQVL